MGMFDELIIDKNNLSDEINQYEKGWQTKSLFCFLIKFHIDSKGFLHEMEYDFDGAEVNYKRNYHTGEIRFYQTINNVWYEYVGFFDEGVMFRLIQIEPFNKNILK